MSLYVLLFVVSFVLTLTCLVVMSGEDRDRSDTSDATLRSDASDVAVRPVTSSDGCHQAYKRKRKMSQASDAWVKQAFG